MGAVAKKPITQVMPGSATAVPWLVANGSATAMRIMGPKEVQQLSQFAAVIVLVPPVSRAQQGRCCRNYRQQFACREFKNISSRLDRKTRDTVQRQWRRKRACYWRCESEFFLHGRQPQR